MKPRLSGSAGSKPANRAAQAGITLVEMLVVVVLIGLMVGIAIPAFQAGLPSIRLRSASSSLAQLLYAARNQVEQRQVAVMLEIDPGNRKLRYRSVNGEAEDEMELPQGIEIVAIAPANVAAPLATRQFLLYPGGAPPAVAVELRNERGAGKAIRLNPMTVAPVIEDLPARQTP
ncbi:MAG: prepilin-type N-terminal cleavage/methylation domain-containing protein [Bryobacterales bacterium]|nr:prepilin-type N-terminal cleavage/methylation domain-containing protein [Bryobacterales bacterium]